MNKYSKPQLEIKPVTWVNGDTPLKYQAKVTLMRPNGDIKVLTGDPMTTKQAALASLRQEVQQRQEDIQRIIEVIDGPVSTETAEDENK